LKRFNKIEAALRGWRNEKRKKYEKIHKLKKTFPDKMKNCDEIKNKSNSNYSQIFAIDEILERYGDENSLINIIVVSFMKNMNFKSQKDEFGGKL